MFKKIVMASALTLAAALPMSANAVEKGDMSLGVFGMITSSDTFDMTMVQASFGMFVIDSLEINAAVGITDMDNSSTVNLGAMADYYFATQAAVLPYVGAGLYSTSGDNYDYAELVVEAGIRQPLSETADIDYKIQRHEPLDDQYEDNAMTVGLVGLRVKF